MVSIFCRECGKLITETEDIMTPSTFKEKYGSICPHCKLPLSDSFNVKQSVRETKKRIT